MPRSLNVSQDLAASQFTQNAQNSLFVSSEPMASDESNEQPIRESQPVKLKSSTLDVFTKKRIELFSENSSTSGASGSR